MNKNQIQTSTPIGKLVSRRKSIHDVKSSDLSNMSPIPKVSSEDELNLSNDSTEGESDREQFENCISSERSKSYNRSSLQQKEIFFWNWKYLVVLVFVSGFLAALYLNEYESEHNEAVIDLSTIKEWFPLQSSDTWDMLESGINEVERFDKPSVFLFLYRNNAEKTLQFLLRNITFYTSCFLSSKCDWDPLILSSDELNTVEANKDYGYIIDKYRTLLEERSVMVVQNFDKIPGSIARAFHTFCDELTPLVSRSVIIFTMKLDEFPQRSELDFVEKVLRKNWNDVKENELAPLLTRVLGIVLKILPEHNQQ